MLRPTLLGRKERLRWQHDLWNYPDLTLAQQTVEGGLIRVPLPLVSIEVVPPREVMVAEAADEPGARSPLRQSLLAEAAAETQ